MRSRRPSLRRRRRRSSLSWALPKARAWKRQECRGRGIPAASTHELLEEPMKAKIVVVGGGVMGVAIAWHAARRADPLTEPIVLLERRALAAGASGRSGAILRQHYSDRVVAAMARDSLRVYSTLERKTGRSIGFERSGVLTLAGPSS